MNSTHASAFRETDLRWLRWALTCIAFLLLVIAVELSVLMGPILPQAQAQIPDSGAQLNQLIEGQKQLNQSLEQILAHLRGGEIKVVLSGTDKDTSGTSVPGQRPGRAPLRPRPAAPRAK